MAKHKSALKRLRQSIRRRDHNRSGRAAVKSAVKDVQTALAEGDTAKALKALKQAESTLAGAAKKGVLHWKTAARKTSRLTKSAVKKS
jgi:small subunit ribosomal protein S20